MYEFHSTHEYLSNEQLFDFVVKNYFCCVYTIGGERGMWGGTCTLQHIYLGYMFISNSPEESQKGGNLSITDVLCLIIVGEGVNN